MAENNTLAANGNDTADKVSRETLTGHGAATVRALLHEKTDRLAEIEAERRANFIQTAARYFGGLEAEKETPIFTRVIERVTRATREAGFDAADAVSEIDAAVRASLPNA